MLGNHKRKAVNKVRSDVSDPATTSGIVGNLGSVLPAVVLSMLLGRALTEFESCASTL